MMHDSIRYLFFVLLSLCAFIAMKPVYAVDDSCLLVKNIPEVSSQVIRVHATGGFKAEIIACQRKNGRWTKVFEPSIAVIGKSGLAALGEKKEGDMKTPAGIYPLGEAFGTQPMALKLDYKYITAEDKFIDDVDNSQYNKWVYGATDAKSYESMLYDFYKMGIVINYNMNPVVPGAGSAIFMHLWRSADTGTFGCIAMQEAHLLQLLHWLDKKQHPYVDIYQTTLHGH